MCHYDFSVTLLIKEAAKTNYSIILDILLDIGQMTCFLKKYLFDTLFLISRELVLS